MLAHKGTLCMHGPNLLQYAPLMCGDASGKLSEAALHQMPSLLKYSFSFSACCSTERLLAPPSVSRISADLSNVHYCVRQCVPSMRCTCHMQNLDLVVINSAVNA